MNSRDYKIFRSGCYYHVYNRGNNKAAVFCCASDFTAFLFRLKLILGKSMSKIPFDKSRIRVTPFEEDAFTILAYCLMPNHYHFLIRQNTDVGVDKLIQKAFTSYAKYYNKKHERVGNLFQDAFKAKSVDDVYYLTYLSAYIHNNPDNPGLYQYSSLPDYIDGRGGTICDKSVLLGMFKDSEEDYKKFVLAYRPEQETMIVKYIFQDEEGMSKIPFDRGSLT